MKRRILGRLLAGLGAACAAFVLLEIVVLVGRWAGTATGPAIGDPLIALYLIFGPQQPYGHLAAVTAAFAALALSLLWAARLDGLPAARQTTGVLALAVLAAVGVATGSVAGWMALTPQWRSLVADTRLWMADADPPTITLTAPAHIVRGMASISVAVRDEGPRRLTRLAVDGIALPLTNVLTIDTAGLPDGEHTIVAEAEDESRQRNRGQGSAVFRSETQWWLSDKTPPVITLTVPISIAQGTVRLAVATSDQGEHAITRLTLDGVALPVANDLSIDTTRLADGEHTLVVQAEDASRQRNQAAAKAVFRSDNNPPTLTVRLDPAVGTQGHTQFVYLSLSEPAQAITATLAGQPLVLGGGATSYWAVIGYGVEAAPGAGLLSARAVDAPGNSAVITASVPVTRYAFPVENTTGEDISLPPEKNDLLNYGVSETLRLDAVFAPISAQQLWQGIFSVPIQGRQTSPFAIRRSYNGGPLGSYHGGLDLAANEGVPVPAANRGRVVLAEPLKVRGNAVIIDHGLGVYSSYYHLSQIKVQKGQMVDKGDLIGLIGTTGVSTGPHLHWEIRVTGQAVDPSTWTQRSYP